MECKTLSNGMHIPIVGLGTWQIIDRDTVLNVIKNAVQLGYSFIDTAASYSNELSIGRAIHVLGLERNKLVLSSKVWNTSRGYEKVQQACKASLKKLKTDYLDSYLVHWPVSPKLHENWEELNAETWRGMEALYKAGLVRSIGVCNFKKRHLDSLSKIASQLPMIMQSEYHPGMNADEVKSVIDWCMKYNVVMQASSPLGNGQILQNETIAKIAAVHNKSTAQVCLRYSVQKGFIVVPKSVTPARLKENLAIFDFSLTDDEMKTLDCLPFCGGLNLDSDEVTQFE